MNFVFFIFLKFFITINAFKYYKYKKNENKNYFLFLNRCSKIYKPKNIYKIILFKKPYFQNNKNNFKLYIHTLDKGEDNNFLSINNFNKKEKTKKRKSFKDISYNSDSVKDVLKKTKKFCNYLTNKLGRLNKKLREIKKLETVFYASPNILTESQKVKISKKKQIKNEIVLINRYRKKYISYKRNLMKNKDDLSPFFYSKKKLKKKKEFCTPEEFREILKSNDYKATIQRIKRIDIQKIPKNITDFLVFNKYGSREEIKILFGLKAIKINGNTIDDENYILNLKEDKVKVFDQDVNIHEDHYAIRKRFTKDQKRILNEKKEENISDIKKDIKELEKFFKIKNT
ncbi:conserved Plasmodium protein, unknown function [Plasmodium gallinaceum]|uniref:Uncharacterized protein n=1 Tax=Plasmodium gallinaceum TaxID=5849 RepID=A0A1J1GM10_PLAGA|nr:conserved Plasmodium protein, unknown function [Plasmodium gallinaceum]CRG93425.1 conserved Plasmodium protein, unknown function [Plasmodium gallinaceum]